MDDGRTFGGAGGRAGRRPRLALGLRLLLFMVGGLKIGALDVELPDGSTRRFQGRAPGPHGMLRIHDGALVRDVLAEGEVGFGEGYLKGLWDSPDLAALLRVLYLNEPYYRGYELNALSHWLGRLRNRWRRNTRDGSRRNIAAHYDLGNAFYRLWLDETMTYSGAAFSRVPDETLADAQRTKYNLMLARLDLRREHHLLEIGCGWGGMALCAARATGCRVTGITLSREQLQEAQARAQAAGLADRVRFELRDYRDLAGRYDRVVSIEMYEAVGEEYWPLYFETLSRALMPGGRAAVQGIVIDESIYGVYRSRQDFIQKYIFPGGMLATRSGFYGLARGAGLEVENPRFFGHDYADTLALWHRNVRAHGEEIRRLFDSRFLRLWRYYLAYCEAGFRADKIDLMQVTLIK